MSSHAPAHQFDAICRLRLSKDTVATAHVLQGQCLAHLQRLQADRESLRLEAIKTLLPAEFGAGPRSPVLPDWLLCMPLARQSPVPKSIIAIRGIWAHTAYFDAQVGSAQGSRAHSKHTRTSRAIERLSAPPRSRSASPPT